ncbi:MAG: transcription elongation factor GreA [Candidatus Ryanbacteria bacterium]|nr:transcription elongation factor GreA [Candidatus Ryanbacteria bacterium]
MTLSDDREYLSPEGLEDLEKRLKNLKTTRRVQIAERLEFAKSLGDLSENAEYSEAKEEQMVNEAEVAKLEDILSRASVISNTDSSEIRLGSNVKCRKIGNGDEQFMIVGREEANPLKGKVSNESPLGKAFLGKRKNEKVLVSTPRGQIEYSIIEIA